MPDPLDRITEATLAYYDEHAAAFWEGTQGHDVTQNYAALLPATHPAVGGATFWYSHRIRIRYRSCDTALIMPSVCLNATFPTMPGHGTVTPWLTLREQKRPRSRRPSRRRSTTSR
jgi:hypothetical protein